MNRLITGIIFLTVPLFAGCVILEPKAATTVSVATKAAEIGGVYSNQANYFTKSGSLEGWEYFTDSVIGAASRDRPTKFELQINGAGDLILRALDGALSQKPNTIAKSGQWKFEGGWLLISYDSEFHVMDESGVALGTLKRSAKLGINERHELILIYHSFGGGLLFVIPIGAGGTSMSVFPPAS